MSGAGQRNAVVSPVAVGAVLSMALQGARAPVRHAIRKTVGAAAAGPSPACRLAAVAAAAGEDEGITLGFAAGAFADRRLDLYPAFAAALRLRFGAAVERLDFADPAAPGRIDAWVSRATGGAIPGLVSRLDPGDALVLASAVQFRGLWAQPFDPKKTGPLKFHRASGGPVTVAAMRAEELAGRYREDTSYQALLLPYGGGGFALALVLPRPGVDPARALAGLAADPSWLGGKGFRAARGRLALPRLSLDARASLLPALGKLGLAEALKDAGGFAGIAAPPPKLSRVVHRARLALDEQGTVAAGAAGAVMSTRQAVRKEKRFEMTLDRPFALAVRHRGSGTVLFAAWVAAPAQSR